MIGAWATIRGVSDLTLRHFGAAALILVAAAGTGTPARAQQPGLLPKAGNAPRGDVATEALPVVHWIHWWEWNADRFAPVRAKNTESPTSGEFFVAPTGPARDGREPPTDAQIVHEAEPALRDMLSYAETPPAVAAACAVALGKLGRARPSMRVDAFLRDHLAADSARVRVAAALGLGFSASDRDAVFALVSLVADSPAGRKLVSGQKLLAQAVDLETRIAATFGLGTVLMDTDARQFEEPVLAQLMTLLRDSDPTLQDLRAAAAHALGSIAPDWSKPAEARSGTKAVHALAEYARAERGGGDEVAQAHAIAALARLAASSPEASIRGFVRARLLAELRREQPRSGEHRQSAAALGLGVLAAQSGDRELVEALWHAYRSATELTTRFAAALAVGEVGGADAQRRLLEALRRDSRITLRPHLALALGVLARGLHGDAAAKPQIDEIVGRLREAMLTSKNVEAIAAAAVALGIAGQAQSVPDLGRVQSRDASEPLVAGAATLGLAMLGAGDVSAAGLPESLQRHARDPVCARLVGRAIGLRKEASALDLVYALSDGRFRAHVGALVPGLGLARSRVTVDPLVDLVEDGQRTTQARAAAAMALGGLGVRDGDPPSWRTPILVGVPPWSMPKTFVRGDGMGILELY